MAAVLQGLADQHGLDVHPKENRQLIHRPGDELYQAIRETADPLTCHFDLIIDDAY